MFPCHHGVKTENEYLGTRRVMSVGYPGSKISTRFNPNPNPVFPSTNPINSSANPVYPSDNPINSSANPIYPSFKIQFVLLLTQLTNLLTHIVHLLIQFVHQLTRFIPFAKFPHLTRSYEIFYLTHVTHFALPKFAYT